MCKGNHHNYQACVTRIDNTQTLVTVQTYVLFCVYCGRNIKLADVIESFSTDNEFMKGQVAALKAVQARLVKR